MDQNNYRLYCRSLSHYKRLDTREVKIGNQKIGGNHPILIQSMTNTDTNDIESSVKQCMAIFDAGADLVRLTAQGKKEAIALSEIRKKLFKKNYTKALSADIHFNPQAAFEAAKNVEKVRINPGNFAEKKVAEKFESKEYIKEKLLPLLDICKQRNVAIRIGVNHGSLSGRMMDMHGDTPQGMVASAIEYLEICEEYNFSDIVFSLKSSNTRVMVQANRLLAAEMLRNGELYPLHLGVTEAGDGEDGRIKSSVGIGALLADGLGDTIRVSLTEHPAEEVPVAKKLVEHFKEIQLAEDIIKFKKLNFDPFSFQRRKSVTVKNIGGENFPVVVSNYEPAQKVKQADYYFANHIPDGAEKLSFIVPFEIWKRNKNNLNVYPLISVSEIENTDFGNSEIIFLEVKTDVSIIEIKNACQINKNVVLILKPHNQNFVACQRAFINKLIFDGLEIPLILFKEENSNDFESFQISCSADTGVLFLDGLADGIFLNSKIYNPQKTEETAFGILQASRVRTTKTEYISCPGCGRTLFELGEVVKRVKEKTNHLIGLKIGIMGCIVNGPGEMADADYGYVGAGLGLVHLYKKQELIEKNINSEEAVEKLIELIKKEGDWK